MKDAPINLPDHETSANTCEKAYAEIYARAAVLADRAEREERLTPEAIIQAVTRGWCHPKNSHKQMDADLAEAIAAEVFNLNAAAPSPAEPPYGPNQRWHICPGCSHQFQSRGSAEPHAEPPAAPVQQEHGFDRNGSASEGRYVCTCDDPDCGTHPDADQQAQIDGLCTVYGAEFDKRKALEAERDSLRALLQEARDNLALYIRLDGPTRIEDLVERIDAALKGTP